MSDRSPIFRNSASAALDAYIAECLAAKKYTVDSAGVIWNMAWRNRPGPPVRLATVSKRGYLHCTVRMPHCREAKALAHRVVAIAAFGLPAFEGAEVNHINGDPADNRPENLEWVTPSENTIHAYATGLNKPTKNQGSSNAAARLDETSVREIHRILATRTSHRLIASQFGVSKAAITKISVGRTWPHIHKEFHP